MPLKALCRRLLVAYRKPLCEKNFRHRAACFLASLLTGHPIKELRQWNGYNCATVTLLIHNNRVLFGMRQPPLEQAHRISLMGGFIEADFQESFEEGARREIVEECCISLAKGRLQLLSTTPPQINYNLETKRVLRTQNVVVVFYCLLTDAEAACALSTTEMSPLVWLSLAQVRITAKEGGLAFEDDLKLVEKAACAGLLS